MAKNAPKLDPHPLVTKMHPGDDDVAADHVHLVGYLGPAKDKDKVRLYHDLSFRSYYEIPKDAIHSCETGDEETPSRVCVAADAKLELVQTSRQKVEAGFLRGAISGQHLAAAAPAAQPICLTVVTARPTSCGGGPICPTLLTAQPTGCGGPICPTVITANPTDCLVAAGAAARPACLTIVTANPTDCGACATIVTANPTDCEGGRAFAAQPAAARPPICPTVVTANPTDCSGGGGPQLCITLVTARPTQCGPSPCITLLTAHPTWCPEPCVTVHTARPTWCPPGPCITIHTARPTFC
ncbi:MAG: hypothetical protein D6696_02340 [Acidobacteria bacterium]|nr:MAG: hypothetical protein D6696_02340 [Acidobacteriota bacterium]